VVLVSGAAATKAATRDSLARAGVIHLAALFRASHGNVLFSSALLAPPAADAPAARRFDPGEATLDLRDVINSTLAARLVVISDGAALSMRDAASDAGTVQWAWQAAGVRATVLSRWTTDEAAAAAFLQELHRQLHDGRTPPDAAFRARQAVRRSTSWSAPFYWSGWIGIGQ
jgi:CHAT domain-containing protein